MVNIVPGSSIASSKHVCTRAHPEIVKTTLTAGTDTGLEGEQLVKSLMSSGTPIDANTSPSSRQCPTLSRHAADALRPSLHSAQVTPITPCRTTDQYVAVQFPVPAFAAHIRLLLLQPDRGHQERSALG